MYRLLPDSGEVRTLFLGSSLVDISRRQTGASAWPSPARACGGTFCDSGPNQMPVDQTGENILFILEPGQVEVHIQIQYDPNTNANKFAWMIPLPEVPEFDVGTELLFSELLRATVPTYGLQTSFDFCGGMTTTDATTGPVTTDGGTTGGEEPPPAPSA